MKNAQEHNEYTEKENDQLRTDALMMINALRAQHGDAVTRVISHLAASDQFSALVGDNIAPYRARCRIWPTARSQPYRVDQNAS